MFVGERVKSDAAKMMMMVVKMMLVVVAVELVASYFENVW